VNFTFLGASVAELTDMLLPVPDGVTSCCRICFLSNGLRVGVEFVRFFLGLGVPGKRVSINGLQYSITIKA
jgi:hypothetical protein